MESELLTNYRQASEWAAALLTRTSDLDAATPCDEWTVRDLLNHMLDTQRYFVGAARGEDVAPPGPNPPNLIGADPAGALSKMHSDVVDTFGQDGVIDKTGPALGIAFADCLVHGWDLARATGQDDTMPEGMPQAAYDLIHGKFSDEQRGGMFKPEIPVAGDASPQERLLAYVGRTSS